jgi:hypothetical protein
MKQTRLERLTKIMDYLAKRGTNKEWVNDAYRNALPKVNRL